MFLGAQVTFGFGNLVLALVPILKPLLFVPGVLLAFEPPPPLFLGQVGGVLWGIGMAWIGCSVMSMRGAMRSHHSYQWLG